MGSILDRLRGRKLFQWALAYLAGAWLLLQVVDLVGGLFAWPPLVGRIAAVLLGIGLLAATVVAWFHGEKGEQKVGGIELLMLAVLCVLAGAAVAFVGGGTRERNPDPEPATAADQAAATADRKIIAVLPFENLSAEAENAFFASGLHDEILTQLSKIGGLKVISRTSVETYEGTKKTLKQIGAELGAGVVAEGSVQRAGDRVRVQIQLIDAATDQHLWAEKYDRQLTDIFAIQSDVAQQIAGALEARLTAGERESIERIPTKSTEAYALYLQARDYASRRAAGPSGRVTLLERAVVLDPGFALAYAALSQVHTEMYWGGIDATETRLERARAAAKRALELQPDLPEGHLALGLFHYRAFRDYDRALQEFSIALRSLPNNASVIFPIGAIQRRQGRWAEAIASFERAVELDPRQIAVLWSLAVTYEYTRDFPKAVATLTRMLALDPERLDWEAQRAQMIWHATGRLDSLRAVVARAERQGRPLRSAAFELALLERRFADAASIMGEPLEADAPLAQHVERALNLGAVHQALGQAARARASFDSARALLEANPRERTGQLPSRGLLALAYAGLGRKQDALREARGELQELPISRDARTGPDVELRAAEVFTGVGEPDSSVAYLQHLLAIPSFVTVHTLRLEPRWDPLRGHPGFQRLLASGS